MQTSPFSYHELHTNNTKTIQKLFKILNFHSHKLSIHIITFHKMKGVLQSHKTPPYILTKRKLIKKLPKTYPSHGFPCDSTINDKKTTSHGFPCDSTINHKGTKSHGSPCDSTIIKRKHNDMIHMTSTLTCESQCIMTKSNP